ncbi:MAG: hypothetical protein VX834_04080, partial [Myxococcota bacterium]|nr:hypothetical protein [Myxococcota bacterium]
TLLEVSPLLAKAGELSEHEFLSWSRELEISEAAHELLRALAPIERASRHKTPLDDLTLHYLAHRAVGDLTLDQIQMIPLKGGSRVPTLDAVLDCVVQNVQDHRHLVIEVKPGSPQVVEPLCELLSQRNMASQATIMSFDLDVIQAVALGVGRPSGHASTHRCLWLACTQDWDADAHGFTYAQVTQNPSSLEAVTETITKSGLDGIYIEYNDEIVTANVLAKLKAQGLFVGVWSSDPNHDCVATVTRLVLEGADLINTDEAITLPKALSEAS